MLAIQETAARHEAGPLSVVRAFIAIDLPASLRRSLSERIASLRNNLAGAPVRWVRANGIHLTLRFLGDTEVERIPDVKQALLKVASTYPGFSIRLAGLGCFPNARRPRVVWLGVEEETGVLPALQAATEAACRELGFQPEARPFSPHLTLGRVRRDADPKAVSDLGRAVEGEEQGSLGSMGVDEVCLFQSDLKPDGAVYTKLLAARLGTGA
ncbi:MAG: 2'-5' RNA ligase [Chloroflexi bacterium RBG_19FT_COMBO_62_14]|nr:MAG: 2'-5' RNA ligase [Chloroflexi bacterium RBG_19FT_COMBO_62_14]